MKVIILAAGYGTRLYPLSEKKAKALLPVKDKPIIEYILEKLHLPVVDEVFIVSNKKFFSQFQTWFKKSNSFAKKKIKLLHNNSTSPENRLGAVRDIDFVIHREKIKDDLLIIGGDNLFFFSLEPFLKFAQSQKPANSAILYKLKDKQSLSRFGVVKLDEQNRIVDFQEKPSEPKSNLISTCVYFFPADKISLISQYLKKDKELADNIGSYIKWLSQNDNIYGFTARRKWFDIGNIDEYSFVNHAF